MRSAALIFGLLAGLLGGAVIALGNLEAGLASLAALGSHGELIAKLILYAIPNLGLLGAGLTLGRPRAGGLLMLLSAVAWAGVAYLVGHGSVLFAALPFTFVAAGGLVALFARRDPEVPVEERELRWPDAPVEQVEPERDPEPSTAPRLGRNEPNARITPYNAEPTIGRPPAPSFTLSPDFDEPPLDDETDYVDAALDEDHYADEPPEADPFHDEYGGESAGEPLAEAADDLPEQHYVDSPDPSEPGKPLGAFAFGDEPAPPQDQSDDADAPVGRATPGRRPRPDQRWRLPEPNYRPQAAPKPSPPPPPPPAPAPPPRAEERYAAERQAPPPSRRQAVPERGQPAPDRTAPRQPARPPTPPPPPPEEFDFAPDDFPPPRVPRQSRPAIDPPEAPFEPYQPPPLESRTRRDRRPDFEPEPRAQRRGMAGRIIRGLTIVVFLGVVLVGAAFVYFDYQRGSQSLLFGSRAGAAIVPAQPAPRQPVVNPPVAKPSADATIAPVTAPASGSVALAPLQPAAPDTPAATPATEAAATETYTDPFAYCSAVDTIDAPDIRFTGPAVPEILASAMHLPDSAKGNLHWRCASKAVYACATTSATSAACSLTPTVELMVAYCSSHPDAQAIPAPNGFWSCNGTRPVIPRDQTWPVDARGFYPGAWQRVAVASPG